MEQVYLAEINIRQVRHLHNIKIELFQNEKKHLLLTGINGCGKTSVLKVIENSFFHVMGFMGQDWNEMSLDSNSDKIEIKSNLFHSIDGKELYKLYQEGRIILVYFPADRKYTLNKSNAVEAIDISKVKKITEKMNVSFGQLLVYLYVETSLEEMCFKIKLPDREEFGLDEMASGYEVLFDIFSEIVIRMEQQAHLKYEWENLFYACVHCNKIKGSGYDNIIDCTKEDPEEYITMRFNSYPENYVETSYRLNSAENKETRELLDKVYNGTGTPISEYEAKNLKKRISKELKEFTECVENYQDERDPKLRAVYWNDIKEMLNRESNFAGFKRSIVLQSEELMQCFGELMK